MIFLYIDLIKKYVQLSHSVLLPTPIHTTAAAAAPIRKNPAPDGGRRRRVNPPPPRRSWGLEQQRRPRTGAQAAAPAAHGRQQRE